MKKFQGVSSDAILAAVEDAAARAVSIASEAIEGGLGQENSERIRCAAIESLYAMIVASHPYREEN